MSIRTLSRPGCELRAWIDGPAERPLVVLVHGAGLDHDSFQHNAPAFAERWRVLNVDVRGHGLSRPLTVPFRIGDAAADLLAWLDDLGTREALWIGHSMGGNLVQEVVRLHPERVRGLVIADCACNSVALSRFERFGASLVPALVRIYPRQMMLRQSAEGVSASAEVQGYVREAMSRLDGAELARVVTETTACMREAPAYRIPRPFLLVRGAESRGASIARQWRQWAEREPHCRREVVIAGAGHVVMMDQPQAFNREVQAFLASLDPAPSAG
jgi:pimeloyl-ACP methyl ester carboxylesterase